MPQSSTTTKLTVTLTGNLKEVLTKKAKEKFGDRKTAVSLYVEMVLRNDLGMNPSEEK